MSGQIRVLVVEDSVSARELLVGMLNAVPGLSVIGTATSGEEAIEKAARLRPDIITMDIHLPGMNGLDATRNIMESNPIPIVIVSSTPDRNEVMSTFRAIEAGALAFVEKPRGIEDAETLVQTVRAMSEVKVVRRWPRNRERLARTTPRRAVGVVAIGASTGGPPVLNVILSALPLDFHPPVLIVQHMAAGFLQGFSEWLNESCALPVRLASHGEPVVPSRVYVAPDGFQMKVSGRGLISLSKEASEEGQMPSVSCLFSSVREVYGATSVAGLLSGMGKDGAIELRRLKDCGAWTFVQDRESAVVYGMPGEAVRLEGVSVVLSPEKIAPWLVSMANGRG